MIFKLCNNGNSVTGTREDGAIVSYSIEAEEYKQWLLDGNTPEPEFTEAELLANAKEAKRNTIREEFEVNSNAPVVVNQVSYHGGFDSAIKLDAVKRLSEALGAINVTVFDTFNVGHILSLVDAQNLITQIAGKYQIDFATKQARMVAVDNATTVQEIQAI